MHAPWDVLANGIHKKLVLLEAGTLQEDHQKTAERVASGLLTKCVYDLEHGHRTQLVGGDWNMTFIFPYIDYHHPN